MLLHACAEPQQHGVGGAERVHPHPNPGRHAHPGVYCAEVQDLAQMMQRATYGPTAVAWSGHSQALSSSAAAHGCSALLDAYAV